MQIALLACRDLLDGELRNVGWPAFSERCVQGCAKLRVVRAPHHVQQVLPDRRVVDSKEVAGRGVYRPDIVAAVDHHHADRKIEYEVVPPVARLLALPGQGGTSGWVGRGAS